MAVRIRKAHIEDCSKLMNLEESFFGSHCNHLFFLKPLIEYGLCLIYENSDGEWIGYALLFNEHQSKSMHLLSFAIIDKFQRQGFGKQLLNAILEYLAKLDFHSLSLSVSPENKAALKLYREAQVQAVEEELRINYYGIGQDRLLLKLCF